ncbi:MAG: potassium transporter TrkA [Epsilonproteobacteria bacterium]|nr:potassium transporter TrkA [Campylobacterota bacterium]
MKKILILADGIVAKQFLNKLVDLSSNKNRYYVVYYHEKTLPSKRPDNFRFFNFDPTSYSKISTVLEEEFYQITIAMSTKMDTEESYKNIRRVNKDVQIVILDKWNMQIEDEDLFLLNANEILANRLIDYLPDIPIIAQNIGLGIGEVMELKVPFGSAYVYRHVGSIEQKHWRIAAIYRKGRLILPTPETMIRPNDLIVIIGEPSVLKSIYKSIKRELGQFPMPFGNNIYLLIDMLEMSDSEMDRLINDAMLFHSKLKSKKLIIRVINPTYNKMYDKIKSYRSSHIEVFFEYKDLEIKDLVKKDCQHSDIGLIIVNNKVLENYKRLFYTLKLPVLKIGLSSFHKIKEGVIITDMPKILENVSSIIFDVLTQLGLDLIFYDFDPDNSGKNRNLIEHFENLSQIFKQNIKIKTSKTNPVRELKSRNDYLQFVLFTEDIIEADIFSIFSKKMDELSYMLKDAYQLFLPIDLA